VNAAKTKAGAKTARAEGGAAGGQQRNAAAGSGH
jgi:hypothetical protein